MHWITNAACRNVDPVFFFPDPGVTEVPTEAAVCCASCPVAEACRRYASNSGNISGVWGGELYEDGLRRR